MRLSEYSAEELKSLLPEQQWQTRNLTIDETSELMRRLTVELGYFGGQTALRVIAELGCGIFKATAARVSWRTDYPQREFGTLISESETDCCVRRDDGTTVTVAKRFVTYEQ